MKQSDYIQVRRDPFARASLVRRVTDDYRECCYCGQHRIKAGKIEKAFKYATETDGGRLSWHRGEFCSIGCHDSYHS